MRILLSQSKILFKENDKLITKTISIKKKKWIFFPRLQT